MKFKKKLKLLLCCLCLLWTKTTISVEIKDLFTVDLVANNESADARNIATKQALFAVLDRIIVSKDIAQLNLVQQMLQNAAQYVKQSQFTPLPDNEYIQTNARNFHVEFDEDQLLEILSKSQLSFWNEVRPQTLLWLVVDEDNDEGWRFYNADDMPDLEKALNLAAKVKGIPLIYPILDLEEQRKISLNDVLTSESDNLKKVSARYETPSIMVGRLLKKGNCWQGGWESYFDGSIKQWSNTCLPLTAAIQAGIRGEYEVLSAYYAIKPEH